MTHSLRPALILSLAFVCTSLATQSAWGGGAPSPKPPVFADFNARVLSVVAKMPQGGGYSTDPEAFRNLQDAITVGLKGLVVKPEVAQPSFCSGASWLVFLKAVEGMLGEGNLKLSTAAQRALLVHGQDDGEGIWGRWNANGPGTPRLVYELGAGDNYINDVDAKPGDFLKIFWTAAVGQHEFGHSVVFLGFEKGDDGVDYVKYFSSNENVGFTATRTPRSRIRYPIWSRITHPEALEKFNEIPAKDPYLGSLLSRDSSIEEAWEKSGVKR